MIREAVKNPAINPADIAALLQQRTEVMTEIPAKLGFFDALPEYDTELFVNKKSKSTLESSAKFLGLCRAALAAASGNDEAILNTMKGVAEAEGVKNAAVMWPERIAVSGTQVTPGGAVEITRILGREEALAPDRRGAREAGLKTLSKKPRLSFAACGEIIEIYFRASFARPKITSREAEREKSVGPRAGGFLCAQRSAGPHRLKGGDLINRVEAIISPARKHRRGGVLMKKTHAIAIFCLLGAVIIGLGAYAWSLDGRLERAGREGAAYSAARWASLPARWPRWTRHCGRAATHFRCAAEHALRQGGRERGGRRDGAGQPAVSHAGAGEAGAVCERRGGLCALPLAQGGGGPAHGRGGAREPGAAVAGCGGHLGGDGGIAAALDAGELEMDAYAAASEDAEGTVGSSLAALDAALEAFPSLEYAGRYSACGGRRGLPRGA